MTLDCTAGMAPRQGSVQVGTITLAYHEWQGGERPCVILHGITSSAGTLWRVGPALAAQGYHVYAFDLPGHGASSETDDHHIEAQAELIRAALSELGLTNDVTLLGHSWGGAIALTLAATNSAGLSEVVLIDPALRMNPERGEIMLPNYLGGLGEPPEATLPGLIANNPDWHRCDAEHKAEALRDCRAAAVRGLFLESGSWQISSLLAEVAVPLLLLVADLKYTVIAPEILVAAEHALVPGRGEMVIVPGTNHNMLRGGFDLTMPVITSWLAKDEA